MRAENSIGLIGVGLMGGALVERLTAAGFKPMVFDVDRARVVQLGDRVTAARDAATVAIACNRVLLSLPDSTVVARVLAEIEPVLRSGQIVIDTTTGEPAAAERAAAALARRGATYLDAALSGSSEQLRRGETLVMVGGDRGAFDACGDLWHALGDRARHVGAGGVGARMKLLTNLVLGLNRAALAEGLAFAAVLEIEPAAALDVLRAGAAYSRIMDGKGEKMVRGDFSPQARLSQHLKDVRLMLDAARAADLPLPLTETHRGLLEAAEALGLGELDNSAVIRVWQRNEIGNQEPTK